MADFQLNLNINGIDTAVASVEDLEAALKATKTEMNTLQIGSEAFNVAAANAQKLDSALKNVKLATEGVDTKQLAGSFAKLGETVTGAFAIATNAIGAFGKENEDVAAASVKAQQAIAVVMGARAVAEGVVEGRAAARLIVDKVSILTNGILAATFGEVAVAEAGAAASANALSIAMKTLPFVAIISAVVLLIGYLADWGDAQEDLNKALDKSILSMKEYTDYVTKLADESTKLADIEVEIAKAKGASLEEVQKLEVAAFETKRDRIKEELAVSLAAETTLTNLYDKAADQRDSKAMEAIDKEIVANRTKYADLKRSLSTFSKEEELFYAKQEETRKNAAKKSVDIESKKDDEIEAIIKRTKQGTLDLDNETVLKTRAINSQLVKDLQERDNIMAGIDFSRAGYKLAQEKKAAIEEVRLKGATVEQIAVIEDEFKKRQISGTEAYVAAIAAIDMKYSEERITVAKILENELAYGDFNLSDRKKKIALDDFAFYNDLAQKKIQSELDQNNISASVARDKFAQLHQLQLDAIQNDKASKKEQLDTDLAADLENAQKQLEAGTINREQYNKTIFDLNARYKELDKQANQEAYEAGLISEQEYQDALKEMRQAEFDDKLAKVNEYANVAASVATSTVALLSAINDGARQEESQKIAGQYSAEENALRAKLNKGEISRKEYDKREAALNAAKAKAEYDAKKKAFEQEKKLRIASTIISGIMGALQAFTGAMQLGPIAGPIVGGILAGLVVAGTAVTVSNISKQQFDGGAQPLTPIDAGAGESAADAGEAAIQQSSAGGFTGFAPSVAGQVGNSTAGSGTTGPVKVVVVESDITNAQRRVSVAESNATF